MRKVSLKKSSADMQTLLASGRIVHMGKRRRNRTNNAHMVKRLKEEKSAPVTNKSMT